MYCSFCGKLITDSSIKYCPHCGKKVDEEVTYDCKEETQETTKPVTPTPAYQQSKPSSSNYSNTSSSYHNSSSYSSNTSSNHSSSSYSSNYKSNSNSYSSSKSTTSTSKPKTTYKSNNYSSDIYGSTKSKTVSLILCLLLGVFGGHRFYAGRIWTGILYLFTYGLWGVGILIDLILILTNHFNDGDGSPINHW